MNARIFQSATKSVLRDLSRMCLTTATVAIALAALIIAIEISGGATKRVAEIMGGFGPRSVMVMARAPKSEERPRFWSQRDVNQLRDGLAGRALVATYRRLAGVAVHAESGQAVTTVYGMEPPMFAIEQWRVDGGSPFGDAENDTWQRTCVLGTSVALRLFGSRDIAGRTVVIEGQQFSVRGVLSPRGTSPLGFDWDDCVWLPLQTTVHRLGVPAQYVALRIRVAEERDVASVMAQCQRDLELIRANNASAPQEVRVVFPEQAARTWRRATQTTRVGGWAIAATSLLISAAVIAALGWLSVTQRRREIGIRRAMGATRGEILRQFLTESLFMVAAGVPLGCGIAVLFGAYGAKAFKDMPLAVTPGAFAAGVLSAVALGCAGGVLPAWRAARIAAGESIR